MKTVLVTSAAGLIRWRTASLLLEQGFAVVGIDNLNDYYDVRLKQCKLESLQANPLGWQTRISLEEGAKRTVVWHIENRQLVNQIEIDLSD